MPVIFLDDDATTANEEESSRMMHDKTLTILL